jgi:hypothetical protein
MPWEGIPANERWDEAREYIPTRNHTNAPDDALEDGEPPLRAATIDEVLADKLPDYRCERLVWDGTVTSMSGLPKEGKTYNGTQQALCLASGTPFLGLSVRQSRVLYMSWEVTQAGLFGRMRRIAEDCGIPDPESLYRDGWLKFYAHSKDRSAPRLDLGATEDWGRLAALTAAEKADVVFIDTLRKACPSIELKDDIGWSLAMQNFNALARARGISIVLIDHGHRGRTEDSAASFAMGSQVKGSELPCLVKLQKHRKPEEPDRWEVSVDSWFDDPGNSIWYQRPVLDDGELGCGCELTEAPEAPTRKSSERLAMGKWLRERLQDTQVAAKRIYHEAGEYFPDGSDVTRERKLREALKDIGGSTETVEVAAGKKGSVWSLAS